MADDKQGMRWKVTKAVRASNLPSPSKLIMLTLADIADVGTAEIPERWSPSLTVLARETSLGRSTVADHLRDLEAAGWVVRIRPSTASALAHGERTRYQLRIPAGASPDVELVQEEASPADGLPSPAPGPSSPAPGQASPADGLPSPAPGHRVRSSSDLDQISSDQSSSATPPSATPKTKKITDDDPSFVAFWAAYPRKVGKGQAKKAFAAAVKKADAAAIVVATEQFAAWCSRSRTEQRFIPHPSTWLNGERWADESQPVDTTRAGGHQSYRNPNDISAYYGDL